MTINRDARILFSSRVQYNAFLRSLNTVATIQATRIATTEVGLAMEAVVLLEGAQTILGAKTFLSPIVAPSLIEDGTPLTSKYEPVFTKNTAFNKDFGSAAGTVTEGDDARLSDARTPLAHVHDAADITTGTIDLARLPAGSLERLVLVADETARFALTTASVQTGDTVQQIDTAVMYRVVDDTQLNLPAGYTEYTAGRASAVDWTGVENKPLVFPPDAHTHVVAEITDFDPADYAALADNETITGLWNFSNVGTTVFSGPINVAAGRFTLGYSGPEGQLIGETERFSLSTPDGVGGYEVRMQLSGNAVSAPITTYRADFRMGGEDFIGYTNRFLSVESFRVDMATGNLTTIGAVSATGAVTGSNLNVANWDAAFSWGDHALAGYLTSFTETDPVFLASAAAGIAGADITNWNTAFGWGDHAGLYQPLDADLTAIGALAGTTGLLRKTAANTWALDTSTYLTSFTETDPVFAASAAAGIAALDISNWDAAFAWGDHALAGYLTSFTETDPVFLASPAAGIAALDITNWNAAFAWGDHALAGYLTSFTETDPVFAASPAAGIAALDITNWNTAFGWGDHAGLYEPTFSKNTAFNKNFGSAAGTVCEGNDARLSDARTPTAHTHLVAEITDFDPADYLPLAGGTMTGFLNADAGARVSIAGSSGNNTSRELLQIFDDRTDRRAGIGTYRGAASTRIGLSFWGSFDAAPVERMRLNDSGDLQILGGDFFLGAGTMQSGSVPWARLTDVPATFTPEAHTHLVADITDFDPADYALDSVVVKLSGTQTIAGLKTFSTGIQANYVGAINTGGSNLRLWAPTGQDVRMEINSDVKLLAQVEGSGDNTTAAQVKHANGSYYDVGMNVMPITDLTTDLTLARSHVGGLIRKWDTAARNLNIPASTDTTIPIGARFEYAAWNPGTVTLVGGTGVQISWMTGAGVTFGNRTFAQGAQVTIVRTDAARWFIWGTGIT